MKAHNVTFVSIGAGVAALAVLGALVVRPALALDDASSSPPAIDASSTASRAVQFSLHEV
jgi:hypothetical protein